MTWWDNTHSDSLGSGRDHDSVRDICNTLHPTQARSQLQGAEGREGERGNALIPFYADAQS